MNYKNYSDLADDIRKNLYKINFDKYDLVVGVPRSGMIPAYMIGLYLNLKVTDVNGLIKNNELTNGTTRASTVNIKFPIEAKKILLVDDSISSGNSLKETLNRLPEFLLSKITTLAIYSDKKKRTDVDITFECIPHPRVFEWNIFHRNPSERICFDIDGVLCIDPDDEENDDGEKYINFILNAQPLFLPTTKVYALVTSRLEKYREQTDIWLKKHGVTYDNLIMLDLPSAEERKRLNAHGDHKSIYYSSSDAVLFIESESGQAEHIMRTSGKPVYCTADNIMYTPGVVCKMIKQPNHFIIQAIKKLLPEFVKKVLKKWRLKMSK